MRTTANLILFLTVVMAAQATEVFHFPVVRERIPRRSEPGKLEISQSGISYESNNGKTSLHVPLANIWQADISDPGLIAIETFDRGKLTLGQRTTYRFRLREAADQQALARFFAERLERPVIGRYSLSGPAPCEIPAYHRHVLGGTHGTIRISTGGVEFLSERPKDSRTWPYRDIETIGSADPFHFRLTSFAETYTFDLKERLPEQAYEFAWQRVYKLSGPNHDLGVRDDLSVGKTQVPTARSLQSRDGPEEVQGEHDPCIMESICVGTISTLRVGRGFERKQALKVDVHRP